VSSDRSWVCIGANPVTCSLQSTLPSPPGNNVTAITLAATAPSSGSDPTVHGKVFTTDPVNGNDPTNDDVWTAFGKSLKAGTRVDKHPAATIVRSDNQSISASLYALFGTPPPGLSFDDFQTDRAILVTTPPASGGSNKKAAISLVITFNSLSKPDAFVFHLNDATGQWEVVNQKCGGNGPFPCVNGVSFSSGVATITVLTLHFSHFSK